jgi:hypothetical protein
MGFMSLIAVANARPGMVLHADIQDRRGRLLLPAGKELSEKHIAALPMWGVEVVDIEGQEQLEVAACEIDPRLLARARARVAVLFTNASDDHPFLNELRELCAESLARELMRSSRESAA